MELEITQQTVFWMEQDHLSIMHFMKEVSEKQHLILRSTPIGLFKEQKNIRS